MTQPEKPVLYTQPTKPFCGLVILGEAPGAEDVKHGRGFIGRSGQLLDRGLMAAGIDRRACIVANVFRYQPPGNKASHFFQSKREATSTGNTRGLVFGPSGYGYCRADYLPEIDQLEAALKGARAVLALGATPLWALTGRVKLVPEAGQILPCRIATLPVIPTYHPAYILRGKPQLVPAWHAHMRLALRHATGSNLPL